MPEKKKKKGFFDILDFGEEDFLLDDSFQSSSSGYSISVTYDEQGKPIVQARIHGDMDVSELRKELEEKYPGAKIEGIDKKPLIRIVGENEEENKKERKEKRKTKKDEKSLIRFTE